MPDLIMDQPQVAPEIIAPSSEPSAPTEPTPSLEPAPKKQSATEGLFEGIDKAMGGKDENAPVDEPPKDETPDEKTDPEKPDEPNKGKVSPFKQLKQLVKQLNKEKDALEAQLAEASNGHADAEKWQKERTELQSQMAELKKRNEQLEGDMRFVDYSKSGEFVEKYQKPLERQLEYALSELSGLTMETEDGKERAINAEDILALAKMPLKESKAWAEAKFDNLASEVMAQRNEVKRLLDAYNGELTKAHQEAGTRAEQQKQMAEQTKQVLAQTYAKAAQDILADAAVGRWFKPAEGDKAHAERLAKGFESAKQAFSANPNDPKLTPEDRAKVVRRHAALIHKAAAFGHLTATVAKLEGELAEAKKKLGSIAATQPGGAGGRSTTAPPKAAGSSLDKLMAGFGG